MLLDLLTESSPRYLYNDVEYVHCQAFVGRSLPYGEGKSCTDSLQYACMSEGYDFKTVRQQLKCIFFFPGGESTERSFMSAGKSTLREL